MERHARDRDGGGEKKGGAYKRGSHVRAAGGRGRCLLCDQFLQMRLVQCDRVCTPGFLNRPTPPPPSHPPHVMHTAQLLMLNSFCEAVAAAHPHYQDKTEEGKKKMKLRSPSSRPTCASCPRSPPNVPLKSLTRTRHTTGFWYNLNQSHFALDFGMKSYFLGFLVLPAGKDLRLLH